MIEIFPHYFFVAQHYFHISDIIKFILIAPGGILHFYKTYTSDFIYDKYMSFSNKNYIVSISDYYFG